MSQEALRQNDAHIAFRDVRMGFGNRPVLRGLSCAFPRGRISVLLGGSGSGKTTILRLIGGLLRVQSGRIEVEGQDVTRLSERRMYAVRRKIGMMFQHGALLDSMNIFDNLALPLREHSGLDEDEIRREVHDRLEAVGLSDVDDLLPGELSGGMMKRVALARAIIQRPQILLCDEPFSGLDPISTKRIESLLVDVNRRYKATMLVVSHHVPSTLRMADKVLLLLPDGNVEGTPAELRESKDPRVAGFLSEEVQEGFGQGEVEQQPVRGSKAGL